MRNPAAGIRWNERAVIDDLSGYPNFWDVGTIRHNVLVRYLDNQIRSTEFDPKSIMVYAIPKEWTLDGQEFPSYSELSESDKAFIRESYPGNETPP